MFRKKAIILIIVLAVLLLVSISAAGYLFWQNQQLKSQLHPVVPSNPTTNQPPKNPVPAVPEYLVKVLAKPTVIIDIDNIDEKTRDKNVAGKISIPVEIKNISVKPFITSFYFSDCKFLDKQGNIYPIGPFLMFDNTKFNKAILPEETITATVVSNSFSVSMPKCSYNSVGENVCQKIEFSRIDSCNAAVSTNENRADQGNKYPLKVTFPQ